MKELTSGKCCTIGRSTPANSTAVFGVSQNRMPDGSQMCANLVGAPGDQMNPEQCDSVSAAEGFIGSVNFSVFVPFLLVQNKDLVGLLVFSQKSMNFCRLFQRSAYAGYIVFESGTFSQKLRQLLQGGKGLSGEQ